jgi:KRAB domain-containing zinc finger protein
LPTQICQTCVQLVDQAFCFRQKCIEVDTLLRQQKHISNLADEENHNLEYQEQNGDEQEQHEIEERFTSKEHTMIHGFITTQEMNNSEHAKQTPGTSVPISKPGERTITYEFVKKEGIPVQSQYSSPNSLLTFADYKAHPVHECDYCGKKLVTKTSLKYHMRTHSGEKPYKCDICDKPLTTKSALEYHMRTHTGEKPYRCEVCGKYLASKPGLDYHMKVHAGGAGHNKKSHECEICGKILTTKPGLEYHMKIHIDEKPYKCDVCNIAFVQQQTLDMHNQLSHSQPHHAK